ncbi:MAG: hypothetical protein HYW81_03445, partial [Parcubacteria group bacterium]|nr:hypothetical protein [Parcubacteria group bacterium]
MTTNNHNHHLHYRTELSLLAMDFLQNKTRFMDIDYVFLYSPGNRCFSAYLTPEGLAQMRQLGLDALHNNPNWEDVFAEAKKRFPEVDDLKNQEAPHILNDEFRTFWETALNHMYTISDSYIFCDQPTVAGLEEQSHEPHVYAQLEQIGRHKLEAHKRLSILEGILQHIVKQCSQT